MKNSLLLINSLGFGGAEKVFTKIANTLSKQSSNVKVVSLINVQDYPIDDEVSVSNLTERSSISLVSLPCLLIRFIRLTRKVKPDLVQSHLFWSNYLNVITGKLMGYESQLVHCVSFESKFQRGLVRKLHFAFSYMLFRRASLNIFKSMEMRDEYVGLFGIPQERTKVIYNPIEVNIANKPNVINDDASEKLLVAVVGRFHKTKRQFDLLEVASKLKGKVEFHMLGDGELFNDFKLQVEERDLSEEFNMFGKVSAPVEYLKKCHLYLSCSESEGFPNALTEAMAVGLPVVHSDCKTGPKEILNEVIELGSCYSIRGSGITFSVGDTKAIEQILRGFQAGELELSSFGSRALQRVKELSAEDNIGKYVHLITKGFQ